MPATKRSMACLVDGPVLVTREQCKHCWGRGTTATPAFAAWEAEVERRALNAEADPNRRRIHVDGQDHWADARDAAGAPLEDRTEDCVKCEGLGYIEVEHEMATLLGAALEQSPKRASESVAIHLYIDGVDVAEAVARSAKEASARA
jgi:hypothetical protein